MKFVNMFFISTFVLLIHMYSYLYQTRSIKNRYCFITYIYYRPCGLNVKYIFFCIESLLMAGEQVLHTGPAAPTKRRENLRQGGD